MSNAFRDSWNLPYIVKARGGVLWTKKKVSVVEENFHFWEDTVKRVPQSCGWMGIKTITKVSESHLGWTAFAVEAPMRYTDGGSLDSLEIEALLIALNYKSKIKRPMADWESKQGQTVLEQVCKRDKTYGVFVKDHFFVIKNGKRYDHEMPVHRTDRRKVEDLWTIDKATF